MARTLVALAVLLIPAFTFQEPEPDAELVQKVRGLILQLKDKAVGVRKKAEDDLALMGPAILPILRIEEARLGPGDLKQRIGILIKRIDRVRRQALVSGNTLKVTLTAKDEPIIDVLDKLHKLTSVPIEHKGLPATLVTSLDAKDLSVWEAVDQICQGHGRLAWEVSDKGIAVRRDAYLRPLMATVSGYALFVRPFLRYPPGSGTGDRDYVRGEAFIVGPPGSVSVAQYLTYETLTDDKNTQLLSSPAGLRETKASIGEYRILPDPDLTRPLFRPVTQYLDAAPGRGSTKMKACKGTAVIKVVIEMERRLEIKGILLKDEAYDAAHGITLEIEKLDASGGRVKADVAVRDRRLNERREQRVFYPQTRGKFILKDSKLGPPGADGSPPQEETTRFRIQAALKDGGTLQAIELWEPVAQEEIKIPFDFTDVPMKKTK
jgi:hypothetical protein